MPFDGPDREHRFRTAGGVEIARRTAPAPLGSEPVAALAARLDRRRGVLLASSYEYPGRYTRWDLGFADPPIEIVSRGAKRRGPCAQRAGRGTDRADRGRPRRRAARDRRRAARRRRRVRGARAGAGLHGGGPEPPADRLLRPAGHLRPVRRRGRPLSRSLRGVRIRPRVPVRSHRSAPAPRPEADRDLVLYLPDAVLVVDHQAAKAEEHRFEFTTDAGSTIGFPRTGSDTPWRAAETVGRDADHRPGEYADCVREAHGYFRRGDLFEVVPGQSFFARCPAPPSEVFRRLRTRNPAPYGALMNLGEGEYLVAASPEMYVRVDGRRIETCPISGTVARGAGRHRRRGADPEAPLLREGGVRAHHVHGRGPKRQVAGMRAGQRAGHRPAPDRDVLTPHPHRGPCRGAAPGRVRRPRRIPRPHLGGHRHRGAEARRDAVHRGPREVRPALVRRGPSG